MKNTSKKGFTLVELVVVIAVIAILAGVLIATFASVIKRANQSADIQNLKNAEIAQKADDIIKKIEESNWFGWEDFEASIVAKIAEIVKSDSFEGSLTPTQVEEIVKDAVSTIIANRNEDNTGVTTEQIKAIVENAIGTLRYEGVTEAQVRAIVKAASNEVVASQLSPAQVRTIVNAANANNLTAADILVALGSAKIATAEDITTAFNNVKDAVTTATSGLATKDQANDILQAIEDLNIQQASQDLDDVITAKALNIRIKNAGLTRVNTPYEVFEAIKFEVVPTKSTILLSIEEGQLGFFVVNSERKVVNPCGLTITVDGDKKVLYKYWTFDDEVSPYLSTYLTAVPTTPVEPNGVGVDVGQQTISSISYTNTTDTARDVVIRTNGGSLTIDAKVGSSESDSDKIAHYGFADSVSIIKVYEASYHEYGSTYQIDITKGRIVLEKISRVLSIHLNANSTGDGYENIVIATTEGVRIPEIVSRSSVTVGEDDILMVVLQQLNNAGTPIAEKTEEVWIVVNTGIADKDAVENEDVVSTLGQLFLETGTQTNVVANKEEAKQQAKLQSIKVDETTYELSSKDDLILFRSLVNGGQDFAGCTVNLKADIDLGNMEWEPIGYLTHGDYSISHDYDYEHRHDENGVGGLVLTDSKPFCGIFNGNGYTISNFKPIEIEGTYGTGLFGFTYGKSYNSELLNTQSAKDLMLVNSTIQTSKLSESNYTCVIKNLNVENIFAGSDDYDTWFVGAVVGIAYSCNINSCNTRNFGCKVAGISGGIAGTASTSVIQNCTNGTNSISGNINAVQNAGGIVGTLENYFYVGGYSHTVIYKCVNYCDVTVSNTNAGGIVGLAQGYTNSTIIDCENNGTISIASNSGDGIYSAGGITANGASISMFYHCTNNGTITGPSSLDIVQPDTSKGVQLGGISCYMISGYFYNCVNNGELKGCANYMGGIVSATHDSGSTLTLVNCGNNGEITNSYATGVASSICGGGNAITQIVGTIDKLSYVQEYLNQLNSNSDLTQITVSDKEDGILTIPSGCANISVNSNVCDKIIVNESSADKLTITCPGVDFEIDGNISSTNVVIEEAKSVIITSSSHTKAFCVKNVLSITNNGTVSFIAFYGQNIESPIVVVNNGTIARDDNYAISFYAEPINKSGSNIVVHFMNNGTISSTRPYAMGISQGTNNLLKVHSSSTSTITTRNGNNDGNGNLGLAFNANGAIEFSRDSHATMNCSSYIHENTSGSYSIIADEDFSFTSENYIMQKIYRNTLQIVKSFM